MLTLFSVWIARDFTNDIDAYDFTWMDFNDYGVTLGRFTGAGIDICFEDIDILEDDLFRMTFYFDDVANDRYRFARIVVDARVIQVGLDYLNRSDFFTDIIIDRNDDMRWFFCARCFEVEIRYFISFIVTAASSIVINDWANAARLERSFIDRDFMCEESVLSFDFSLFEVVMREGGAWSRVFVLRI